MVFYITSPPFQEVINRAINELDLICAGNECKNQMKFLEFMSKNAAKLENLDYFIVDLSALTDSDTEIIQALEIMRIVHAETKIIILASHRQKGEQLLIDLMSMGIYDIILADVFAQIFEELNFCLSVGKQYKDVISFKERDDGKNGPVEKKEIKRTVNKILVGVTGSQMRIGCTHLCATVANHLRKRGYMVAVLEYGQRDTFNQIQEAYEEPLVNERYFTINGVDYYARVTDQEILELLQSRFYNFIFIDFGLYDTCDQVMFSKCDIRMLVTGVKPWETQYMGQVFHNTSEEIRKQLYYIFNFADDNCKEDIRSEMAGFEHIHFLPLAGDPFTSKDIGDLEQIFAFYEQQSSPAEEKKKKGLFGILGRK